MIQAQKTEHERRMENKLEQGIEKIEEITGIDMDVDNFNHDNEYSVTNGYNDVCNDVLESLTDKYELRNNFNGDYQLYFDAKKNIMNYDLANGEGRLTDYYLKIATNEDNDAVYMTLEVIDN